MQRGKILQRVPPRDYLTDDLLLECLLDYLEYKKISLYSHQEEAILELFANKNVILNTPTGSGKSLVASALHLKSIAWGRRSVYTSPIKALVNEKFLALCNEFGPHFVGMVTGDASINANAPILCCTAEILANMGLRDGNLSPVDDIIMDEFHYYSDKERGIAWQIPLLTFPQARFLLMSATLGDTSFFQQELTRLTSLDTVVVKSNTRPVPLNFVYQETPLHETVLNLLKNNHAPVYLVHFTQADATESAQNFLSHDIATKEEKRAIAEVLIGVEFKSPFGKELQRILKHGIGLHHAGLLPRYRIAVEKLAQRGLLKIICGTDTLGVGINVPIRTVVFTKLCKYNGEKTGILSVRDFLQISGRAGRKGFDDFGTVIVQAPEHVIENIRLEEKSVREGKNINRIQKKQAPKFGFIQWNKDTFLSLTTGEPEALNSRFTINHAMLLNMLSRGVGGCSAIKKLIKDSHEPEPNKRKLLKNAFVLFRSLYERKIVEPLITEAGKGMQINVSLQEDFSLNQALSLYLVDTIKLLDATSPDYALDILTLVESILENPDAVLRRQVDLLKTKKMGELKQAGVDYDERIAALEEVDYPKPQQDFIYGTFNDFATKHPWVSGNGIRPKSIAREMFETFQGFYEYIRTYRIQRSEGVLLRYLTDVYKTMLQNIPDLDKNDDLIAIQSYFGTMIRTVDASLLEEWEKIRNINSGIAIVASPLEITTDNSLDNLDLTRDARRFRIYLRNEAFRFLRAFAADDFEEGVAIISNRGANQQLVTEQLLEVIKQKFLEEHGAIRTDREARDPKNTTIALTENQSAWRVELRILDDNEHNDWVVIFTADIEECQAQQKPVLRLEEIRPIGIL